MNQLNLELSAEIANYYSDPLGFVLFAFPWGQQGKLKEFAGPDKWQEKFLIDLGDAISSRAFNGKTAVAPIRMAVSSGHGIGKSSLVAMLIQFLMATRPNCRGTVTATTSTQLLTRTWAATQEWNQLSIAGHWFDINNERMFYKGAPKTWFTSAQTCKEEQIEAFQGQHANDSTSFYIMDEASGVPDKIFDAAEGGLTDGEPMIFQFGNPTKSTGKFFRVVFGNERERWNARTIDSRESAFTNKEQIKEWEEDWGEDSDFFRVKVRGVAPRASDLQFIDYDRIHSAQSRGVTVLPDEPLIMGVDLARGGMDFNVIRFRRGLDARTIPPVKIRGDETRDSTTMIAKITDLIQIHNPKAVFIDATGGSIGGPLADRIRQLGFPVLDVQFGGKPPDLHYADMRTYMWAKMRDWLEHGAIDRDNNLEADLASPIASHNKRDRLALESKEAMKDRGLHSPDDGDALAMTFAIPVFAPVVRRMHTPTVAKSPWN